MKLLQRVEPGLSIIALLLGALAAGWVFYWLWRNNLLYAVFFSLVLFSGMLLPSRPRVLHALLIGLYCGAFIGSGLGMTARPL